MAKQRRNTEGLPAPHGSGPTALKRRLGIEMRKLRRAKGFTLETAGDGSERSRATIWRIETGRVGMKPGDVRDLCELYEVPVERTRELQDLTRRAKKAVGWWEPYGDAIPEWFEMYVDLEAEASSFQIYQSELVDGVFQTEEYAQAVIRARRPDIGSDELERQVSLRMTRQSLLTKDDAPRYWLILNEAVIRRVVGECSMMHAQLQHLADTARLPNVTLQVLPFKRGAHAGMDGSFYILGFPDSSDVDLIYMEQPLRAFYFEEPRELAYYAEQFNHLRAKALDTDDSLALIRATMAELS